MKRTVVLAVAGISLTGLAGGCALKSAQPGGGTPAGAVSTNLSTGAATPKPAPGKSTDPTPGGTVIARANGRAVTREQLQKPLVEGYGLNILLNLVQLELAAQQTDRAGLSVTPDDVKAEYDQTLSQMFKDADKSDYPGLLDQMLTQQHLSPGEFEIVMRTNANLRKVVEPQVTPQITDEMLRARFNVVYGELVRVRHIQCANMQEWADAKRRVDGGEAFADVARAVSRNAKTAPLGGLLPPFGLADTRYPDAFKRTAFGLKVGETSDAVQAGDSYQLLKLEERVAPKAVKFEDLRDTLRVDIQSQLTQAKMAELRRDLGTLALRTMTIEDPVLRKQWEEKLKKQEATVTDKSTLRKQIDQQRKDREPAGVAPSEPSAGSEPKPAGSEPKPAGGVQEVPVTPGEASSSSPGAVSPERPPATQPAP